ncbi:MAG: T9SS type A sorting domain-containing protein [Bacteroidales bacterium]|nr:T9SS type A sorting domain-containing protein [Bacteroidales bacterium]
MKKFLLSGLLFLASLSVLAEPISVIYWSDDWDDNTLGIYTIDVDENDNYYISNAQNLPSQVKIHCWDQAYVDKDQNVYTIKGITSLGTSDVVKQVSFGSADEDFSIASDAFSGLSNLKVLDVSESSMAPFVSISLPSTVDYVVKSQYDESVPSTPEGWNVVSKLPSWYTGVEPYLYEKCYYNIQNDNGVLKSTLVGFQKESYDGHNKVRKVGGFTIYDNNSGESLNVTLSSIDIDENINKLNSLETICLMGYFDANTLKSLNTGSLNNYCKKLGFQNYYTWQFANFTSGLNNVVQYCDTVRYDDNNKYKVMTIESSGNDDYYYKPKAVVGVCDGFFCNGGRIVLGDANGVNNITELKSLGANKDIESVSITVKQEATIADDAFSGMKNLKAIRLIAESYYKGNEYVTDKISLPNVEGVNFIVSDDEKKENFLNQENVYSDAEVPSTYGGDNDVFVFKQVTIDRAELEINLNNAGHVLDLPSFYFYHYFGIPLKKMSCTNLDVDHEIVRAIFSRDFMADELDLPSDISVIDLTKVDVRRSSWARDIDLTGADYVIISKSDYQSMSDKVMGWEFSEINENCQIITPSSFHNEEVVELTANSFPSLAEDIYKGFYPNKHYVFKLDEDIDVNSSLYSIELNKGWIFDGQGHSIIFGGNMANSNNALFGLVDEDAEVKNLTVENLNVMAGDRSKVVDDEYTYYPILARENKGTIKNCVVSGSVMCDEDLQNDDKSIACFVVDNSGMLDHVVEFYNYGQQVEGNKRNIVIMQNMGVGRNAGQTQKVCNNRKNKNKSLSASPAADVNNDYREYTDDEMASGEPAYWLNYTGKGYSGIYSRQWSKGKMYPIMATELSKPVVKIVYDINGATESEAGLINPLFFANEDDDVEINLTSVPDKVWVGDGAKELNSVSKITKKLLSSACKNGIVTIHLSYGNATDIADVDASAQVKITANGQAILVNNAENQNYTIFDILGHVIANGTIDSQAKTINLPSSGIYVAKVGDNVKKVVVR